MTAHAVTGSSLPQRGLRLGGVPWRATFLRHHLARELTDSEEILVLRDLQSKDHPISPLDFFFALPDFRMYQPVPVRPIEDRDRALQDTFRKQLAAPADQVFDLTALLQTLRHTPGDSRSVLLEGRSGAGKTVACRAALFDCFYFHEADRKQPRLDGLLPCVLRSMRSEGAVAGVLQKDETQRPRVLLDCLIRTARPDGSSWSTELVQRWLNIGPPLLLLVDLNAVAPEVRRIVAQALCDFLRSSEARTVGHRAVITYRSHAQDDTLRLLQTVTWDPTRTSDRDRVFVRASVEPVGGQAPLLYLRSLRTIEANRSATEVDEKALDEEVATVRALVDRFDIGEGSLINTPLLLYFVGALGAKQLQGAGSPAGLYDRVVDAFLKREEGAAASAVSGFEPRHVRLAMCRLALVILAQGAGTTRLSGKLAAPNNLSALFEQPKNQFKNFLPDKTLERVDPFWHDSPYLAHELPPFLGPGNQPGKGIGERSFVRKTGDEIGFVHDSFVYYFVASALRYFEDPDPEFVGNEVGASWREAVVRWMHKDPAQWKETVEFLGGMLERKELSDLAFDIIITTPKPGWPTLLLRLLNGRRHLEPADPVAAGIEYALHHKEGMVERFPAALRTEVYHYLRDGSGLADCRAFGQRLEKAGGCAWLYSQKPTWWPAPSMCGHGGWVTCVKLLPDGCVVSGSDDGRVLLWDPIRLRVKTLIEHKDGVTAVAVSNDGRTVVSGSKDRTVRRWTQADGPDPEPLITHERSVDAVAVSSDGRTVVSGSFDNTVRRWTQADGPDPEPLITHKSSVCAVAVSSEGRTVVSGSGDRTLQCWLDGDGVPCTFLCNSVVRCLIFADTAGRIAAGLANGEVLILDLRNLPPRPSP